MAGLEVDFAELLALADDIESVEEHLPKRLVQAVGVTSKKVKDHAQKAVRGRKQLKGAAAGIDYELKGKSSGAASGISSEIGYNKDKGAGKLGNLLEFGAPKAPAMMNVKGRDGRWKTVPVPGGGKRPLPPGGELQAALDANSDDLVTGVENAVSDAMKDARL